MSELVVNVHDAHRTYGSGATAVHALRGASLTVRAGEIVSLVGPSGSGKTTLLNCIAGLDRPSHGAIHVLGTDVGALGYEGAVEWRRESMAIVFQASGLLPHLSAHETIDAALRIRGISRDERRDRTSSVLEQLGLASLGDHRPGELSGGQQQRVALARALAARPTLLIADEPTGQLDHDTSRHVLDALRSHTNEHGTTMLLATHDPEVAAIVDRSVRLVDGRVVAS